MAQPTSRASCNARPSEEQSQLMQQTRVQEHCIGSPRVMERASSPLIPLLAHDIGSAPGPAQFPEDEQGIHQANRAHEAPAYVSADPVPAAAIEAVGEAEVLVLMDFEDARTMFMNRLPVDFSVPDPAKKYLLKFGAILVSLENLTAGELGRLMSMVMSQFRKDGEASIYRYVEYLLSLGADVDMENDEVGYGRSSWVRPLAVAVSNNDVQVLRLLLRHGACPGGSFKLVDDEGDMNVTIVRELLKAGADPWLSIGQPEQLPKNGKHVSIADFYRQTGMDINARMGWEGYFPQELSMLELAYGDQSAEVLKQLLEAGAHVGDAIRLRFGASEKRHFLFHGRATADAIDAYRLQRAYVPYGFAPYALLQSTVQPSLAGAVQGVASATGSSASASASASGSPLAQAALKPACNALIDGRYTAPQVMRLLGCLGNMPEAFGVAVVQALSLARVLGHYSAGTGARASQVDQGIRLALTAAGLWEKHLECKAQFETLQSNIDCYQADGSTLLTTAASNGKIRMIRLLAALGAKVNFPDAHGNYPLTAAAKAMKSATCSTLLALGANAGTSGLQGRSTLMHVVDWFTQTDISDAATLSRIVDLIDQLLRLEYDFRQPTPENHPDHAAYPTVADLLCAPQNCVKLALLGPERTYALTQAILFNIDRRGSQPFLSGDD